jgi:hypothetical protein
VLHSCKPGLRHPRQLAGDGGELLEPLADLDRLESRRRPRVISKACCERPQGIGVRRAPRPDRAECVAMLLSRSTAFLGEDTQDIPGRLIGSLEAGRVLSVRAEEQLQRDRNDHQPGPARSGGPIGQQY